MNYRFEGMICKECRSDEHLYADAHGIFCGHCGPGAPVISNLEAWVNDRELPKRPGAGHYQENRA